MLPLSSFHRLGLEAHLLRSIMSTVSSTLTSMLTDALEGGAGGGAGKAIRDVAQEDPLTSGYQLYSISKKFVFEKGGFVEKAVEDTHGIAIKTDYFAKVSKHTHVIAGTLLRHPLTPCLVCVSCLVCRRAWSASPSSRRRSASWRSATSAASCRSASAAAPSARPSSTAARSARYVRHIPSVRVTMLTCPRLFRVNDGGRKRIGSPTSRSARRCRTAPPRPSAPP